MNEKSIGDKHLFASLRAELLQHITQRRPPFVKGSLLWCVRLGYVQRIRRIQRIKYPES